MEPTDHWFDLLEEYDVWCGLVQELPEARDHPQVKANDMIRTIEHPSIGQIRMVGVPFRCSETPGDIETPLLEEHGDETRERLGSATDT
jgi:CoA:oxalate CoA-transferase